MVQLFFTPLFFFLSSIRAGESRRENRGLFLSTNHASTGEGVADESLTVQEGKWNHKKHVLVVKVKFKKVFVFISIQCFALC